MITVMMMRQLLGEIGYCIVALHLEYVFVKKFVKEFLLMFRVK